MLQRGSGGGPKNSEEGSLGRTQVLVGLAVEVGADAADPLLAILLVSILLPSAVVGPKVVPSHPTEKTRL